jgi:hypothetical protein
MVFAHERISRPELIVATMIGRLTRQVACSEPASMAQ